MKVSADNGVINMQSKARPNTAEGGGRKRRKKMLL